MRGNLGENCPYQKSHYRIVYGANVANIALMTVLFTFKAGVRGMLAPRENDISTTINPRVDHFFFYCASGTALLIIQHVIE